MAKTGAAAQKYIDDLVAGIEPKFAAELSELQKMKQLDAQPSEGGAFAAPRINIWDWRYYQNQLKKQKFAVDAEALREFFPVPENARRNVHHLPANFWSEIRKDRGAHINGLTIFSSGRSATPPRGEPLGLFYLDMFPRDGKYQSLRRIRHYRRQTLAGWKISAADCRHCFAIFRRATRGQTVALTPLRSRNLVPRVWSRPAYHHDPRASMGASPAPMSRAISSRRPRKCCKTGSGTKRCSILSRRITVIQRRKFRRNRFENEGSETGHRGRILSTAIRLRFARSGASCTASGRLSRMTR